METISLYYEIETEKIKIRNKSNSFLRNFGNLKTRAGSQDTEIFTEIDFISASDRYNESLHFSSATVGEYTWPHCWYMYKSLKNKEVNVYFIGWHERC
jgi:hypothetical protein